MSKYLVTGGAGFIGSHVVEELVRKGEEVVVVDNLVTGFLRNIRPFLDRITFIEGSLSDVGIIHEGLENVDYVIHLAALPSVPRSIRMPIAAHENNATASLILFEMARQKGVRRVVCASSSSQYGDSPELPKKEHMTGRPLSFYAAQKSLMEQYARLYSEVHQCDFVVARFFNVFGPRQNPNSEYSAVIPLFIKLIHKNQSPTINGDGLTSRDFTYVSNVVDGLIKCCESEDYLGGEVFNLACGGRITLNELVDEINNILGKDIAPKYAPFRLGDIPHSQADIAKAANRLDYKPSISFKDGLLKTCEYILQNEAIL